jgi:hypothetical protein
MPDMTTIIEDDAYKIRTLDPVKIRLFRTDPADVRVRMTLDNDRSWTSVVIARAFPFSKPDQYVGLQDAGGGDIGIMPALDGLDAESLSIVRVELERRYFTPTVRHVHEVAEKHGAVNWVVETDRGPRRFVVRNLRDNANSLGPMRVMLTDTEGNRYHFPNIQALGRRTYEILAKVMA